MYKFLLISAATLFTFCASGQNLEYPSLYKALNLPEYPGAVIKELGQSSESLKDGVKIFLETEADYSSIRSFYEGQMENLGWSLQESISVKKMREMGKLDMIPFSGVFEKGDLTYQVFTSRMKNMTKVNITLLEK